MILIIIRERTAVLPGGKVVGVWNWRLTSI